MNATPHAKADLMRLGTAYFKSKVLLSAVELGLFTHLAASPATEPELRDALGLHPRASRDFLDSLVALGLLTRTDGRYHNAPAADAYLDTGKPAYVGGFLTMLNLQFAKWDRLTDLLRTGGISYDVEDEKRQHDGMYADAKRIRRFMAAMDGINQLAGPALAERFDWSEYGSVTDLGGARGNVAAELVKAHPHLSASVFDLPPVEEVFDEHMAALDLTGRVRFEAGDFFAGSLPASDVLIYGHVLHDWSPELRTRLIRQAYAALPPGGALLVYDVMIDDERAVNDFSLLTSLHMMLVSPGGGEYTAAECRAEMTAAGFAETDAVPLTDLDTLVIGRKAR
ncbi:methyltransferase [Actinoallomurus vinaceus]|uniref:Methyltransferase n=1 Tax=Actinoallomurus vinaceus TaxID=1080074 RepID=A0ABP8UT28_9ACTN